MKKFGDKRDGSIGLHRKIGIQSFFMTLQTIENRPMPSGILKVGWIPNYKPTRF